MVVDAVDRGSEFLGGTSCLWCGQAPARFRKRRLRPAAVIAASPGTGIRHHRGIPGVWRAVVAILLSPEGDSVWFRRRSRASLADPVAVGQLRESLARERRIVLSTNPWPMLGIGVFGLAGVVVVLVGASRGATSSPSAGMVVVPAVMGFVGFGMAVVYRHPFEVDESGLHARGPLHFDIDWGDITGVSVTTFGVTPRWGRQLVVQVDPASLAKYEPTVGPWMRLMARLARGTGIASFQVPPLRIGPETAAAFIQQEAQTRETGEAVGD